MREPTVGECVVGLIRIGNHSSIEGIPFEIHNNCALRVARQYAAARKSTDTDEGGER